jgi:hypothetical protein
MTEALRPELITIIPTRGRPGTVAPLALTFETTCTADTQLVFAVDSSDPDLLAYAEEIAPTSAILWINQGERTMVAALNSAAKMAVNDPDVAAVAFMGDDHRPRTRGWDRRYLDELHHLGAGIVYGDDLLQHVRIPTQVAISANIIRALGRMAPPTLTHLFVDNYWRDLGVGAGCLRYLPDVVVEHMHPYAGKADWDAGHRRVNDHTMYAHDQAAYGTYVHNHHLDADVEKVKALR